MNLLAWGVQEESAFSLAPALRIGAMGVFDGLHRGHRVLLQKTLDEAHRRGGEAWVITFDQNPARVLSPGLYAGDVQSLQEKMSTLEAMGFSGALILPFDEEFRRLEAPTFLSELDSWFPLEALFVGENFHLGRYPGIGARDIGGVVREMGGTLRVDITPLANDNDSPISSTRIRDAITKGKIQTVTQLLGRPFRIDLRGVPLLRHGNTWGLLRKWVSQVMPKNGNYSIVLHGQSRQIQTQGTWKSTGAYWEHTNLETLEFLEIKSLIREIPEG